MSRPHIRFRIARRVCGWAVPVCPATPDLGVRRLFDLATLLLSLDCRPGDRVLDLGAGAGFSSEMLARLGYDVIASDPDLAAPDHNRRRLTYDPSSTAGIRLQSLCAKGRGRRRHGTQEC